MSIVTGQQIHLLGGPLFILFKVIGCYQLAQQKNTKAIYWLETFDSDFSEINRLNYLDQNDQFKTLVWQQPNKTQGLPCGLIPIDKNLKEIFENFFADLKKTKHTTFLKEKIFSFLNTSENLATLTLKIAEFIFYDGLKLSKEKLVLFNPYQKDFLDFCKPYLLAEIERTPSSTSLLAKENQCNAFCFYQDRRQALFKKNNRIYNRLGELIPFTKEILLPNVKTRNLLQDSYFNTDTYIAGPSEWQYINELKDQYSYHKVTFPNLEARMSAVIVDSYTENILKKHNTNLKELSKQTEQKAINNFLKKEGFSQEKMTQQLTNLKNQFIKNLQPYPITTKKIEKIIYKELKNEIQKKRKSILVNFKNEITEIKYLYQTLLPLNNSGKKQEKVFNLFYYLNLYGLDFLKTIYTQYNKDTTVIYLKNN